MTMYYSDEIGIPRTNWNNWILKCDGLGASKWIYDESGLKTSEQTDFVKLLLNLDKFASEDTDEQEDDDLSTLSYASKGLRYMSKLQDNSGIFPNQYKGPMFMTIGYLAANYFIGQQIPEPYRVEMIRYIVNTSHPVDGGWGLHNFDKSTCFGTTMNYVSLRLLGMSADHPVCVKARKVLHRLGGAIKNPHWGKAWLSILNLYEWEGVNPAPPDFWLLPYATPIHPGRWWVHTRGIYLPLSYLCSNRVKCDLDPLLEEIRSEIYLPKQLPFHSINFSKHRNDVCGVDLYYPHTIALDLANWALVKYEKYIRPNWLLKKANTKVYDLIKKECINTDYLTIAPVSYAFTVIAAFVEEGKDSDVMKGLLRRMDDVAFMGPQGMTVMGTNGSQCWDTSFALQSIFMSGLGDRPEFQEMIERGFKFLVKTQITEETVEGSYRDKRTGAWPFSTKSQGYTVSDCTAEALKAVIMTMQHPSFSHLKSMISEKNLFKAADILLSLQNRGHFEFGSFASYEMIRSTTLVELLNPAEVFNNIMVEYPYVECTDSSVLGLTYFAKYYPEYRSEEVRKTIVDAVEYIKKAQKMDGSWYGCWGICFTYAGMFALEAMHHVGLNYHNSDHVKKGCDFLVSKQLPDGGWSECMKSCETHTYVNDVRSLVIQTAWVLIGLILSNYPDQLVIERGIKLLIDRQKPDGKWEFESIEGVFNHSCAIEYPNYRFIFPIKALGLYAQKYENVNGAL